MIRRVFRLGNSLAITLPPGAADLGIQDGSVVEVEIQERHVLITPSALTADLIEWTDSFIERHRGLLDRLT